MKNRSYSRLAIRVALFYFTIGGVCQGIRAQTQTIPAQYSARCDKFHVR
jgi:hypothetical protein